MFNIPEQPMVDFNYHQQLQSPTPEKLSNHLVLTVDSLGSSHRYINEVEFHILNTNLVQSLNSINKQIKEPEKTLFIETHKFCEMTWWVISDILPDGSHRFNERLTKYVMNNLGNLEFLKRITDKAIFA